MTQAAALRQPFHTVAQQIVIDLPGARGVFTTRLGGHSLAPYDTLNLGLATADEPRAVSRNHQWLQERFGVELAYGRQVHGNTVRQVDRPTDPEAALIEADGLLTKDHGLAPMVFTADCVPVLLAGGGVVAAVHAGWKGLAAGIIPRTVARMRELGTPQAPLGAAIGPCAGVCCYEVGEELHERFDSQRSGFRRGRNLDLSAIAAAELRLAGVRNVEILGLCTICDSGGRFFSHRREAGITGRQGALAWLN